MKPERWQQIKGLYESALRCDEGKRASFLDQACAGDPALRREVESLLAYENREDGFIETPALEVAARALTEEKAESLVGRQLGSYKILSVQSGRCRYFRQYEAYRPASMGRRIGTRRTIEHTSRLVACCCANRLAVLASNGDGEELKWYRSDYVVSPSDEE